MVVGQFPVRQPYELSRIGRRYGVSEDLSPYHADLALASGSQLPVCPVELQADEIKTIVGNKEQLMWIFAVIEVWSRFWPSTVVGKRRYQNTLALFRNVSSRMILEQIPLIVTDGFGFYDKVVRRLFGPACLYGRVIKTRRNDCIVKVERRAVLGDGWRLEQALQDSEDSVKLNTSFVERLNLTIRQGSAYLGRRTICYARSKKRLEDHLELLRCHYNFVRPHRALKVRTRSQDPSYASWSDPTTTDVKGNLLFEDGISGVEQCPIRALRLGPVPLRSCLANASGGLATIGDGSTSPERPAWNAHPLVEALKITAVPCEDIC